MTTETLSWVDEARRLLAEGHNAEAISRQIGISGETIRVRLDINGAAERYRKKLQRYRHEGKNLVVRRKASRDAHVIAPTPLIPPKVSVPYVSILAGALDRPYQMVRL